MQRRHFLQTGERVSLILRAELRFEHDVVLTRQRARQIAGLLGFDAQDQTRIATAVSEIARNAFEYGRGGVVEFALVGGGSAFQVRIRDEGPGFEDLPAVLEGRYRSRTGMGLGITGARRLVDDLSIDSPAGQGSTVTLTKRIPPRRGTGPRPNVTDIAQELARSRPADPFQEMQQQNQELVRALGELRARQEELERLNRELDETNRGVVALYAELDERADFLRRTNEVKSKFLSNMSHEFRSPLSSILSLSRMLLEDEPPLVADQQKQVNYILRQAENLSELVNDLLDMAKVEAGKVVVRPHVFSVTTLFSTLRGMLRPLLQSSSVALVFEELEEDIYLDSDEAKVSQILRNFISNALKFTQEGEVRVRARVQPDDSVAFSVADTGVGIAPADFDRVFQEYVQVDNPLQHRVKGTGLGLPLSKRFAEMLGGSVGVESRVGEGSTFYAFIPRRFQGPREVSVIPDITPDVDPARLPVLVVEDNRETLFVYEKYLKGSGFQAIPARTVREARQILRQVRPVATLLDVLLQDENTWGLLEEMKTDPATRDIPVFVVTLVENREKALALEADGYCEKPVPKQWLLDTLRSVSAESRPDSALVVDDDEVARYLLCGILSGTRYQVREAANGEDALRLARQERPTVIFLDLVMPGLTGQEVLMRLKEDPSTRDIPVIIHTSSSLTESERADLLENAVAIVSKSAPSREASIEAVRAALEQARPAAGALEPCTP